MSIKLNIFIEDQRWKLDFPIKEIENEITKTLENKNKGSISIIFTNDSSIRKLNKDYRNKDCPTNVLSFPNSYDMIEFSEELGDVFLAFETINKESIEYLKSFKEHSTHMIIHGILHILGYDHINDLDALIMENYESLIMKNLGFVDPWLVKDIDKNA